MYDLPGKNGVATGSSRGLGLEFSRRLLKCGISGVVISDIVDDSEGEKVVQQLRKDFKGRKIHYIRCDVTKAEDWENLWNESERLLGGKIHVLLNNAGVPPTFGWEANLNIMGTGATRGIFTALDRMSVRNGGEGGRIIQTASVASLTVGGLGGFSEVGYNISKWGNAAAIRYFGEAGTKPYNVDGVKCWGMAPYFTHTRLVDDGFKAPVKTKWGMVGSASELSKAIGTHLMTPEDVGETFEKALQADKDGAIYVTFPDAPHIEFPSMNNMIFKAVIIVAKLLARTGLLKKGATGEPGSGASADLMTPNHFFGVVFAAMFFFVYLLQVLLGWIF